ncbi:DNA recombination protein rmuC [Thiohalobacter thiocyanaticus]|uniref:DNA recombination protein rmuC n=1 Tax=Thiohalobacter thiocyanaticus TaxID=585455 RepID=A0A1Z4VQ35_9GAMM|nr:DNA recombination protein RmuC [Thiohalobacter thiocyanaticus]BAZ93746.1 DNA recombination protein rmuC [Thiohalobacter thiocyanaticus]
MPIETFAFAAVALLIGAVLGYLVSRSRAARTETALDARLRAAEEGLSAQTTANTELEIALNSLRTEHALTAQQRDAAQQSANQRDAELKALTERHESARTRLSELEQALARAESGVKAEQSNVTQRNEQIAQLRQELEQARKAREAVEADRSKAREELATLRTSLDEKQAAFDKQLAQFDEQKQALKQEFQNLANEILEAKGKAFKEQSQASLDSMLKPFRDQIEGFRKRVEEVHTNQTQSQASLRTELTKLHELNRRITDEAANLTKALKGDKKLQGSWGEIQVEMILDRSGLQKGTEYEREANFKDEEHKNWRPDFIVHLPEGKHVIIDSKVSLVAYNDYVAAETDEEREGFLKQHVQSVRKHISDLSARDYPKLKGLNSPDFVFMFMPVEPAFVAAFQYDPELFNSAFEKRIVVVTPTTLLASLRTIANLWSIERQNQNARTLADQASKVYDKLRIFVDKMDRLGNQLATAQKTYDDANNTLTGSRSLSSSVQKFVDLGVRVKKELPATVVETALLDDDDLKAIAQPGDDEPDTESETQPETQQSDSEDA